MKLPLRAAIVLALCAPLALPFAAAQDESTPVVRLTDHVSRHLAPGEPFTIFVNATNPGASEVETRILGALDDLHVATWSVPRIDEIVALAPGETRTFVVEGVASPGEGNYAAYGATAHMVAPESSYLFDSIAVPLAADSLEVSGPPSFDIAPGGAAEVEVAFTNHRPRRLEILLDSAAWGESWAIDPAYAGEPLSLDAGETATRAFRIAAPVDAHPSDRRNVTVSARFVEDSIVRDWYYAYAVISLPGEKPPAEAPALADVVTLVPLDPLTILEPGALGEVPFVAHCAGNGTYVLRVREEIPPGWGALAADRADARLRCGEPLALSAHAIPPAGAMNGTQARVRLVISSPDAIGNVTAEALVVVGVPAVPPLPPRDTDGIPVLESAGDLISAHPVAAALGGVAATGALGAAVVARSDRARWALAGLVAPLYTRLARPTMLDKEARAKLHAAVVAKPGASVAELARGVGLAPTAAAYHLRHLERHGFVTSRREGAYRRFRAVGAPASAEPSLTPMQARIVELLREKPLSHVDVADRLGLTRQGVNYHVKALERRGIVTYAPGKHGWVLAVADVVEFERIDE